MNSYRFITECLSRTLPLDLLSFLNGAVNKKFLGVCVHLCVCKCDRVHAYVLLPLTVHVGDSFLFAASFNFIGNFGNIDVYGNFFGSSPLAEYCHS